MQVIYPNFKSMYELGYIMSFGMVAELFGNGLALVLLEGYTLTRLE